MLIHLYNLAIVCLVGLSISKFAFLLMRPKFVFQTSIRRSPFRHHSNSGRPQVLRLPRGHGERRHGDARTDAKAFQVQIWLKISWFRRQRPLHILHKRFTINLPSNKRPLFRCGQRPSGHSINQSCCYWCYCLWVDIFNSIYRTP